jgi:polysaccharide pyruvyl transferase WcaK-like protein
MIKVTFAGAYGIHSQGDDAALITLVEGLRQRIGVFDGVVLARHCREDAYAPWQLRSIQNLEYEHKSESIGKWFYGFNYGDDRSHLEHLQDEIATGDLLILGAGNFLVDKTIDLLRGPIPYFFILTLMAKMVRTPVMWFGISVGPFRTDYGRRLSRLAADLADVITVRDAQSSIELQQLGYDGPVLQLPDPVLGLRPPPPDVANSITSWRKAHQGPNPVIAVSLRDSILETRQYTESMVNICDMLVSNYGAKLLFIPHCTYQYGNANDDDRNIARQIVQRMRHRENAVVVSEDLTVEQCLSLYSGAELAICVRLHGNVYSAIQAVPSIAIGYNPKVAGFMNWLGRDDMVVPLPEFSAQTVMNKVKMAVANRSKISSDILARVAVGRDEVENYSSIASDLIMSTYNSEIKRNKHKTLKKEAIFLKR